MYLLLILASVILLSLLIQWCIQASTTQVKRAGLFAFILILLLLAIIVFKFGGIILAAFALAIPVIRKLYTAFSAYQYIRKMRKTHQHNTRQTPTHSSIMSKQEARDILGVKEHATEAEIKAAYLRLMQKNHPDQGGSDYFAKKLNQARDVLIGK